MSSLLRRTANRRLFSLALVIYFICTTDYVKGSTTSIELTNGLPEKYGDVPLNIRIRVQTKDIVNRVVKVSDSVNWSATEDAIYYVAAILGDKFASVNGFEPKRDAGHETVFWLVKEDGFYLSYNKISWKKEAPWDSE